MAIPASPQAANHNTSMTVNSTTNDTAPFTGVELYALVAGATFLLAFGLLGMLSSLALLLAPKCKQSVRSIIHGLPYMLAATNLVLCILWVPVEVIRLVLNYSALGLHPFICYTGITLFYFAISTIVSLNICIAFHRLTKACCEKLRVTCVIVGMVISLVLGVVSAYVSLLGYNHTLDYAICTQNLPTAHSPSHYQTMAITLIWVATLFVIAIIFGIMLFKQKHALSVNASNAHSNSIPLKNSVCGKTDNCMENENSKVHFLEPGSSKEKSSSKTSLGETICPALFGSKENNKNKSKDEDPESDLDDDEFDQRMKFKLQKASSGRRHTVANIGFGESLFAPRSKEGGGSKPTSPTTGGYQYVRKWSVDIIALQDQLENPKAHAAANPFGKFQGKGTKKEDTNGKAASTEKVSEKEDTKSDSESKTQDNTSEKGKDEDKKDDKVAPEEETLLPVPNVKVEGDGSCPEITQDGASPAEKANMVIPLIEVESETLSDEDRKKKVQAMQQTTVSLLLLLVVLFCILPFSVIQWLHGATRPLLNRNVSCVLAIGCVLQTVLHTFLIAWMERGIWQALRRMHIILTHWKCVCYCNIGKGKSCMEHPHYNGQSTSA